MRLPIVFAHAEPTSFNGAMLRAGVAGLPPDGPITAFAWGSTICPEALGVCNRRARADEFAARRT